MNDEKRRAAAREIEELAAAVHQAYLDTCRRLGWPIKPENDVPYTELSDDSKELDRASVRAVLAARHLPDAPTCDVCEADESGRDIQTEVSPDGLTLSVCRPCRWLVDAGKRIGTLEADECERADESSDTELLNWTEIAVSAADVILEFDHFKGIYTFNHSARRGAAHGLDYEGGDLRAAIYAARAKAKPE